jgi:hypothetical protein
VEIVAEVGAVDLPMEARTGERTEDRVACDGRPVGSPAPRPRSATASMRGNPRPDKASQDPVRRSLCTRTATGVPGHLHLMYPANRQFNRASSQVIRSAGFGGIGSWPWAKIELHQGRYMSTGPADPDVGLGGSLPCWRSIVIPCPWGRNSPSGLGRGAPTDWWTRRWGCRSRPVVVSGSKVADDNAVNAVIARRRVKDGVVAGCGAHHLDRGHD